MANEAQGSIVIEIGGVRYTNFTAFSLQRSRTQATTCSGQIVLAWPGAEMFNAQNPPAQAFTDCAFGKVFLDGKPAAAIWIDSRTSQGSPSNFQLTLQFRGKMAHVIDSSVWHETGQENNKTPIQIIRKLLEGHDIEVLDKVNISKKIKTFIINDGDTVERSMRRVAREMGFTYHEDEEGKMVLEVPGEHNEGQGQMLQIGRNFTDWSVQQRVDPRFADVYTKHNSVVNDDVYGKTAEQIAARANDASVKCKQRIKVETVDTDHDKESAIKRAKLSAVQRSAQGLNVTLKLSTWSDDGGELWKLGKRHHVVIPVDQIDKDLEVELVRFELTKDQRRTTMVLTDRNMIFNVSTYDG